MKRTLIPVLLALLSFTGAIFCTGNTAQAGWWHHHHQQQVVYAYPAYFMPQQAPATIVQAQSGLSDAILLELIKGLRLGGGNSGGGSVDTKPTSVNVDLSGVKSDLADLKADIKHLDARVENINSTVQQHGEAFGMIMSELKDLKKPSSGIKKKEDLQSAINADRTVRERFDALFQGVDSEEKAKSRDSALNTIYEMLHK